MIKSSTRLGVGQFFFFRNSGAGGCGLALQMFRVCVFPGASRPKIFQEVFQKFGKIFSRQFENFRGRAAIITVPNFWKKSLKILAKFLQNSCKILANFWKIQSLPIFLQKILQVLQNFTNFSKIQQKFANAAKFAKFAEFQKFHLDNLVDFEKCCKTHIYLQKSVPIQPKTSKILPKICQKFATTLRGRHRRAHQ